MDEVPRPDVVRANGLLAIFPQLRLYAPLGRLVPQLEAQIPVNAIGSLTLKGQSQLPKLLAGPGSRMGLRSSIISRKLHLINLLTQIVSVAHDMSGLGSTRSVQ